MASKISAAGSLPAKLLSTDIFLDGQLIRPFYGHDARRQRVRTFPADLLKIEQHPQEHRLAIQQLYPAHVRTRKSFGLMMRKMSDTSSQ
jgi:hypothetical protein